MKTYKALGPNLIVKVESGDVVSKAGIIVSVEGQRESQAREEGVIEQIGESAFDDLEPDNRPVVGSKVVIARYDGKSLGFFKDKCERRVIQDTRILAIVEGETDE